MIAALSRRTFVVSALLLAACVKKEPIVTSGGLDAATVRAIRDEGVAIAPVVAIQDLPAPPIPSSPAMGEIEARLREGEEHLPAPSVLDPTSPRDAAFLRNEYFGNVRFGGGFVRTGDVALEVRARLIELGMEDRYRDEGLRWLGDMVPRALTAAKIPIGTATSAIAPVPERRRFRGIHPEDGHDNVNLPRTELVPVALSDAERSGLTTRWLVVPYLRTYVSHNGGWFLGQTFGCTAGARVEALVALYDTTTGRPVWWMTTVGRHIQPQKGQPSTSELDQYLLWAEKTAEDRLAEGLLE